MTRRVILVVLVAIVVAAGTVVLLQRERSRPNIVVIVIDTLRADHLPPYGYTNKSPFFETARYERCLSVR